MMTGLVDHLWQSTLFAGVAGVVTLALRKNRAQVRYWVWFAASVKFLAPFAVLAGLGALVPLRHDAAVPVVRTEWVKTVEQIGEPLVVLPVGPRIVEGARTSYVPILLGLWVCGFLGILMRWGRRWARIRADVRMARPMELGLPIPVRSSAAMFEPGVFGVLRPVLLLPEGIGERLSREQLNAIVAHELCHVRRRDNLTAAMHMFVQALFWFHPLVWWIGARLIDERERACDEEVLRLGSAPGVYAEGILNVCKLYVESPVACVAGVTGSDLKKRVEAIMKNRNLLGLSFAKKAALAVVGVVAIAMPIVVGVLRAQPAPRFEVAAIRPCKDADTRERGGNGEVPRGRLSLACTTVDRLIWTAYVLFANDRYNAFAPDTPILGAPGWAKSDGYEIDAKAEGPQSWQTMSGSMLGALLEDRFKLRMHRETREVPVYALTVAKGGPELQSFKEGTCIAVDPNDPEHSPFPRLEPGQPLPLICGMGRLTNGYDFSGVTMATFSRDISFELDRPVIDRTGIAGMFTIHLDLSPADLGRPGPDSNDPAAPQTPSDRLAAVGSAIEKLGLKLESSKGPGEFIVVDHVERPSEN